MSLNREQGRIREIFSRWQNLIPKRCWVPNILLRSIVGKEQISKFSGEAELKVTDNKLQTWEWLLTVRGELLKADAFDHSQAPDRIGCQDMAWDLVGAWVEFDLKESEYFRLIGHLKQPGKYEQDRAFIRFYFECYLVFHAAQSTVSADLLAKSNPEESARFTTLKNRYLKILARALEVH